MKTTLTRAVSTPAYVIDAESLRRRLKSALNSGKEFPAKGWTVGFSVKTNSHPVILKEVLDAGLHAEVVSADEWNYVRRLGFDIKRIIYNGPVKSLETFVEAVNGGATVNIDSLREVQWLEEMDPDHPVNVGVRLQIPAYCIPMREQSPSLMQSRFGFSEESGELARVISRLHALPFVRIAGLHLHRSTQSRKVEFYHRTLKYASEIIHKYDLSCELSYLDIGGGFSAPLPGKADFNAYAQAISRFLKELSLTQRIIIEPGHALVSDVIDFVTTVVDVHEAGDGKTFVVIDGSRHDIDPHFRTNEWKRHIVYGDSSDRTIKPCQTVCGCTCMEQDRMFDLVGGKSLKAGDVIVIHNAGSYTYALAPNFIRHPAAVYIFDEGRMIRCPANGGF